MPDITIAVEDAQVKAALKRAAEKLADMTQLMERIGVYYTRSARQNFDNQSSPDGQPWQRLSNATMHLGIFGANGFKKGKKTKGYLNKKGRTFLQNKKILIQSHDLMTSIHHQADRHSVTIGTGGQIKYAAIHQFGGMAGRNRKVKIPARPFLAVNTGNNGMELAEKDRRLIIQTIEDYLAETTEAT